MKPLIETSQRIESIPESSVAVRLMEGGGVLVWTLLWAEFLRRALTGPRPGWVITLAVVFVGFILADFGSGFFHWFFDTFLHETTPLVGKQLVAPFREHHRDPLAMTRHSFLELNGNNCVGFLPSNLLLWWFGPAEPESVAGAAAYFFAVSFCFFLTATNQLHSWAHAPKVPRVARWLQRMKLAVSPEHHAVHHKPPHRVGYCVTSGWVNQVTDRTGFFEYAERFFVALGVPRKVSD